MPRAAKDPGLDVSPSGPTRCSGLPAFRVVAPRGTETPLVVEAPHAGLFLDGEALASLVVPARSVARDADLYVDELVEDAADEGATLLCAHTSRYLVDLNRAETEHDGHAVAGSTGSEAPHGIVWHRGTDGESALRTPLPSRELERRLATYYRPYHAALAQLLADKQKRFGHAILVCAHSMPSNGTGIGGRVFPRADVVPGTRGRASASSSLIDEVDAVCRSSGLSVRHDDPYRGGFSTAHYGRPDRGVHAIQIELARRLYMNEDALCRIPEGVARMRAFYRELARRLARVVPSRPV